MQQRFEIFIALSIAAHLCVGAYWFYKEPVPPPVVAKPNDSVSISIGLQAAIAGAMVQPTPAEPEVIEEIIEEVVEEEIVEEAIPILPPKPEKKPEKKPEPKPEPKPEKKPEPKPEPKPEKKPEPKPEPKPEKKPEPKPEPKPEKKPEPKPEKKPEPKPEPKPEKKPEPKPEPKPVAPMLPIGQQGIDGSVNNQQQVQETGTADAEGGVRNESEFDYYIRQHLLAKKRTPKVMSRRKEGIVTVEFTIDRQGNVLSHKISEGSRIREFDRAAVKLIKQAAPFPAAPDFVTWQQRTYTIAINYQVN